MASSAVRKAARILGVHVRTAGIHLLLLRVKGRIAAADDLNREDVILQASPAEPLLLAILSTVLLRLLSVGLPIPRRTRAVPTTASRILQSLLTALVAAQLLLAASPRGSLDRPHIPVNILHLRVSRPAAILAATARPLRPTLLLIPILLPLLRQVVTCRVAPALPAHLPALLQLVVPLHRYSLYSVNRLLASNRKIALVITILFLVYKSNLKFTI